VASVQAIKLLLPESMPFIRTAVEIKCRCSTGSVIFMVAG